MPSLSTGRLGTLELKEFTATSSAHHHVSDGSVMACSRLRISGRSGGRPSLRKGKRHATTRRRNFYTSSLSIGRSRRSGSVGNGGTDCEALPRNGIAESLNAREVSFSERVNSATSFVSFRIAS